MMPSLPNTGKPNRRQAWPASVLFLSLAISFLGCESGTDLASNQKEKQPANRIVVSSYPLQLICRELLPTEIDVEFAASDAEDARIWQPTPADVSRMQSADLVLIGGPALPYAEWVSKVSLPQSKTVQCGKAFKLADFIHVDDYRIVHQHGPEGEHSHPLLIPHFWLDPAMASKLVAHLSERFQQVYPEQADAIGKNADSIRKQLKAIESEYDELSERANNAGKWVFTNPNFSFLARRLGIENEYLVWLEDKPGELESRKQELAKKLAEDARTVIATPGGFASSIGNKVKRKDDLIIELDLIERPHEATETLGERLKNQLLRLQTALEDRP